MHTSISHLTGKEQNDLRHISKRLAENIAPEFIFCYGNRTVVEVARSCFTQSRRTEKFSSIYDIVIIVSDEEKVDDNAILVFAENVLRNYAQTNIIVHRKGFVFKEIEEGNFFFSWLFRSAMLLHSKGKISQHKNSHPFPKSKAIMYPDTYAQLKQFQNYARSFLTCAREHYRGRSHAMALYMIKQSIVASCKYLLFGCLGYQFHEHDLDRLFNLTHNFTSEVINLFPRNTKEEIRLFQLLLDAMGTAYTNEMKNPTEIELIILIHRTAHLMQVSEKVINKKIAILQIPDNLFVNDSNDKNENSGNTTTAGAVLHRL